MDKPAVDGAGSRVMQTMRAIQIPTWVPEEARRYLEHTENGRSIRQLARRAGCHPSTVLRQVRRIETLRDDPLIDSALSVLSERYFSPQTGNVLARIAATSSGDGPAVSEQTTKVLVWLNQPNAVLAYAQSMDQAVIVTGSSDKSEKLIVTKELAGEIALRGWISCMAVGRLSRYQLSEDGRAALARLMAAQENRARIRRDAGFAEAARAFQGKDDSDPIGAKRVRYGAGETPLATLARLVDRNGEPFLTSDLVRAGERLREDFELAQIAEHLHNAQSIFEPSCHGAEATDHSRSSEAQQRATDALAALGPGLSDIALRCCCHLEGLETAEKQLGWSARSGKVVLRIALQQLKSHYDALVDRKELIG